MSDPPVYSIIGLRELMDFLRENEALITKTRDVFDAGTDVVGKLSSRLEKNRIRTEELLRQAGKIKFSVASDPDVKRIQRTLVKEIRDVNKKIEQFGSMPSLVTNLLLLRSALYLELGNTYSDMVAEVVAFTQQEIDQLRELLRRAVLDTESRERISAILNGAINISKFVIRFALKLT